MRLWFDQYVKSRSFLRFLRPFFSLRFWKLNYRTLQIKASKKAWGKHPYSEYLQYYYSKNANPYYETVEDKWNIIRSTMIEMAELRTDERVLDLGTGLGFQATAFATHGYSTVGVDFVFDRLKTASEKHKKMNLDWILADATRLPLPDDAYEVITISLMLHAMPIETLLLALSEIRRVAKRRIVIAEPRIPDHWLLGPIYKNITLLFDESIYMKDFLETDFEMLLKMASLQLIEWRLCAHNTLAVYVCEV